MLVNSSPSGRQCAERNGDRLTAIIQLCYTQSMSPFYSDTDPKMEALQVQLLRMTPSWGKMEMLTRLNASARSLALAGLRQRFPQAGEAEIRRYLADLLLGHELARKVLGEVKED